MDEINKIEEALKTAENPVELASYLTKLAAWNSFYTEKLKEIQIIKPQRWLDIQHNWIVNYETGYKEAREKPLSDKKTEMTWASTEQGQEETNLIFILKRLDILYRSISKRLSAIENDFRMTRSL